METRKKVLVFVPEFPVLTETFIERELSKLVERENVDLVVVAIREGRGSVSENLKSKIFYKRLGLLDVPEFLAYFLRNFSKVSRLFREMEGGLLKKTYLLLKAIGYTRYFASFHPDLIFSHFMSEPSTIAMVASNITGVPFAVSAHAKDVTVGAENVSQKVRSAKFVTICNKNAYDHLLKLLGGVNPGNIYLSHHGIDVEKVVAAAFRGVEKPSKPLILSVGRFTEKKGYKYLVEAAKILKDKGLDFLVYIVGFGPLYQNLMEEIKNLRLEEVVKILGENQGLPNEETLKYFKSADVFVFPSIETKEGDVDGIANVLLEAAVFKLPVVATDAGSTTELIVDGETGLVIPQRDPKALVDALEKILKDRDLGIRLGQNAYNKVLENFNLNQNILNIEGLINK